MFDGTVITNVETITHSYNAYVTNLSRLTPTNANDQIVTNFTWLPGPLGAYYQPTNSPLLNMGSQSAASAGLYHFTVLTNEVKETTNQVTIGLHYVALDGSGLADDYDNDGIPDYVEDTNGNGSVSSGETDWQSATDLGLKIQITRPTSTSELP
jgi:hypothetical protein